MEEGDVTVDAEIKRLSGDSDDDIDEADDVEYDLDAPGKLFDKVYVKDWLLTSHIPQTILICLKMN